MFGSLFSVDAEPIELGTSVDEPLQERGEQVSPLW